MKFDVFLCHNSSDKEAVKKIGEQLREAGLKPWLDVWELPPGRPWQKALEEQIATIGAAAIFVGPDGFGPWQDQEKDAFLRQFVKRSCPVIPVILAQCQKPPELPIFLEAFTWVDFRAPDPDPFRQLIWGITGEKPSPAAAAKARPTLPLNNLPSGSLGELFKGREDLLEELEKYLDPNTPTALVQAKTLSGLGGVGKTRLAIEYAIRQAAHFSAIFFVNADNKGELRRGFAGLAGRTLLDLGLPVDAPEDVLLEEVKVALRAHPGWLLILDNVDSKEAQQALRQILPLPGQVLITSRLQHWPAHMKQLQVEKLDPKAAKEYLLKATESRPHRADDDEAAAKLSESLDYLPLALELSAAYVRENHVSFAELVANWAKEQEKLLDWYDESITDYPRSLAATWSRTFDQLKPGAQALLKVLAHLAPEPIPHEMLEEGQELLREAANGELDFPAALVDLQRYSLLTREQEGEKKTITLHRLVQAVARGRIAAEEKALWAERAVRLVDDFAPLDADDARSWPIWDPLRPHAAFVLELADGAGVAQPTAGLMSQLALLLKTKALYTEAEPLLRRSLAIAEASFGPADPKIAANLNNLAQLLQDTDRLTEAEPLMRRALAIDQASLGQEHPNVAIGLSNLGQLLQATNRFAEAEPLMRRALKIDQVSFGENHSRFATQLNNLASLLHATNRLAEAELLMRRALASNEANFGNHHPNVAISLGNLGQLLLDTNRSAEAEPLMRRALAIDESVFGVGHPLVAAHLSSLGQLLQATNRLAEAEPLMRRALAIDEASVGKEHPDVARDINNLAQLLQTMNRLAEAEALIRRSLAIDETSLGGDHPAVARDLNNLAGVLLAANRLDEAEPLIRRSLAIDEASFGKDHPKVATRLNNLAQVFQATNRHLEAEPLIRRSLTIDETSLGKEHPDVAVDLNNLAMLLQATNRLAEAEPLMRRSLAILEASLGAEHPSTATVRRNLAQLLAEIKGVAT